MKRLTCLLTMGLVAGALTARQVSLGSVLGNPGAQFTIPVMLDDTAGIASISCQITYDPTMVVLTGVTQGSLAELFPGDFIVMDEPGCLTFLTFRLADNAAEGAGSLAKLAFTLRPGSERMVSGITLASVTIREHTGTKDLTIEDELLPGNGLLQSVASTADCRARLGEQPLTIAAKTQVKSLTLRAGDSLCTADDRSPIVVTDALTAEGEIAILPPERGWATGTYALLKAPTAEVALSLTEAPEGATLTTETDSEGLTTYLLTATVENEIPVTVEEGAPALSAEDAQGIRNLLTNQLTTSGASEILVQGSQEAIELGIDLGLEPESEVVDGVLKAVFQLPTLTVKAFDPQNGRITVCVTPGGKSHVAQTPNATTITGVLHVHGTDTLGGTWRELPDITINLDAYQQAETPGELTVTAQFGNHTFIKVVAGRTSEATTPEQTP